MLFLQEQCVAAGMDYDQVLDKSAVWEGPVSTANTANGVTVKQDGDAAAKPGKHMHFDTWKRLSCHILENTGLNLPAGMCRWCARASARRVV